MTIIVIVIPSPKPGHPRAGQSGSGRGGAWPGKLQVVLIKKKSSHPVTVIGSGLKPSRSPLKQRNAILDADPMIARGEPISPARPSRRRRQLGHVRLSRRWLSVGACGACEAFETTEASGVCEAGGACGAGAACGASGAGRSGGP